MSTARAHLRHAAGHEADDAPTRRRFPVGSGGAGPWWKHALAIVALIWALLIVFSSRRAQPGRSLVTSPHPQRGLLGNFDKLCGSPALVVVPNSMLIATVGAFGGSSSAPGAYAFSGCASPVTRA